MIYTFWQLPNDMIIFFHDKDEIHIVIFVHRSIWKYNRFLICKHRNGTVVKEHRYTHQKLISRLEHFFNNCCLIYTLLVYVHQFLWIILNRISIAMLNEISTVSWLCNEILTIFIVCIFPLYFVFNKIYISTNYTHQL